MLKKIAFFILISSNIFSQEVENDSLKNKFDYDTAYYANNFSKRDFIGFKFPHVNKIDINGELFESNNSKRLVLYNFWQKHCAPCITETDMLNQLESKFSNDVDFIGITYETKEDIIKFNKKHLFDFRHLSISENVITNLFIYNGYPATFLVFDGEIIAFSSGGPVDSNSKYYYVSLYNTYSKFRTAIENKLKEIKK